MQLRVTSATPKLAEFDAVCTRQLDLLLSDNPLRGTAAFDQLRTCILTILRGPMLQRLQRLLSFDLPRRRSR